MKAKAASPEMKSALEDSMKPSAYSLDEDDAALPKTKKKSALEDSMSLSDYSSDEDEDSSSDEDDEWEEGME